MHVTKYALAGAVGIAIGVQSTLLPALRNRSTWLADRRRKLVQKAPVRVVNGARPTYQGPVIAGGTTSARPPFAAGHEGRGALEAQWEDYSDLPEEVQQTGGLGLGAQLLAATRAANDCKQVSSMPKRRAAGVAGCSMQRF